MRAAPRPAKQAWPSGARSPGLQPLEGLACRRRQPVETRGEGGEGGVSVKLDKAIDLGATRICQEVFHSPIGTVFVWLVRAHLRHAQNSFVGHPVASVLALRVRAL